MKNKILWGVASSAYQIEGAYQKDGKGISIWDEFANTPGNTKDATNGNIAVDFYHRYQEDIVLMKEAHLQSYRFSISWTRIMPEGKGKINQQGIDYYKDLCKCLKEAHIEPIVTIYHWDLPLTLEKEYQGWLDRRIIPDFVNYASYLFEQLSDYVNYWIIINEPNIFTEHGYLRGIHPPKTKDMSAFLKSYHHTVLATAYTVQLFKLMHYPGKIGTSIALLPAYGESKAEQLYEACQTNWFFDPIYKGEYPDLGIQSYSQYLKDLNLYEDEPLLKEAARQIDFIGVNYYQSALVSLENEQLVITQDPNLPQTPYHWTIDPKGLTKGLKKLYERYHKPILISENGYGSQDYLINGMIHDDERIDYMKEHIEAVEIAMVQGVEVIGYCWWSFSDCLSWLNGYEKRYGLVYVDFEDPALPRIRKDSFFWYKEWIKMKENEEK